MNNSLEPKQKPVLELKGEMILQVEKRSSSKMFWNKRIIILKDGILSYYSKVPKQLSDISKLQPKTSVHVENILYIGPPEKPKKQNTLEITFMAKDAIKPSKQKAGSNASANQSMINSSYGKELMASQQPIVITKKKEIIIWEVAFSKKEQFTELVQAVDKSRHPEPVIPQKQDQSVDEDVLKKNADQEENEKLREEQARLREELEKEKQLKEQEKQLRIEKENQLGQEKEQLLQQLQLLEEQKNQISQNQSQNKSKPIQLDSSVLSVQAQKPEQLKIIKRDISRIDNQYNYKFLQAQEISHIKDLENIEDLITNSFQMHKVIAQMKKKSQSICEQIIDELCLPNSQKSIKPTTSQNQEQFFSKPNEQVYEEEINFENDFYIYDGFIIKLSFCQLKTIRVKIQQQDRNLQIYDESALKSFGNEFRYLSLLADHIEAILQDDPDYPIRVPLSSIIDYKGVRAFALAVPPINEKTLIQGPKQDGSYINNTIVSQHIIQLSKIMNLKPHNMYLESSQISHIPLSLFVEAHNLHKEDYLELRWLENQDNVPDFYPQNLNLIYLSKCADVMPMHVDESKELNPVHRLRPEYVRLIQNPLNCDAFLSQNPTQDSEYEDLDVSKAGQQLKIRIKQFIQKLELLEYVPCDSLELTEIFHKEGLNIRLIGQVCSGTNLVHIKEMCLSEMIARVCKKVLRNNLADLMKNLKIQITQKFQNNTQSEILEYSLIQELSTQDIKDTQKLLAYQQKLLEEVGMDFINLILGTGKESDMFWNQIVQKQIWYDYQYSFDAAQRYQIQGLGLLLYNILQQCDISYPVSPSLISQIFRTTFPLKDKSSFKFTSNVKFYKLQSSRVSMKTKRRSLQFNNQNKEAVEQSISWGLDLLQIQEAPGYKIAQLYVEQAELFMLDNQEQALNLCLEALKLQEPYHSQQLKTHEIIVKILLKENIDEALQYFENALSILDTHVGPSHPFYSTIYCIMGYYFLEQGYFDDSLALYQSSLTCSQRVLGSDHPQIAEIYTDLGLLMMKKKELNASNQFYEKAISIFQKQNQYQSIQYSRTKLLQGALFQQMNYLQQANDAVQIAVDILEQHEYQQIDQLIDALKLQKQINQQMNNIQKIEIIQQQLDSLLFRH
ncbi:hypothetical protein pb186bvf_003546 [Paramecium bursaria]